MSGDVLVSVLGLSVNVVVMAFLAVQLKLFRDQVRDARDAFTANQEREKRQSTLEFLATTMERRHTVQGTVPPYHKTVQLAAVLDGFSGNEANRRAVNRYLSYCCPTEARQVADAVRQVITGVPT